MSATVPHRGTTGCWTCRLRRKKCEEGGMPCRTCQVRGFHCHGYGPRPAWKDRGDKEKAELQNVLRQGNRKPRCKRTSSTLDNLNLETSIQQSEKSVMAADEAELLAMTASSSSSSVVQEPAFTLRQVIPVTSSPTSDEANEITIDDPLTVNVDHQRERLDVAPSSDLADLDLILGLSDDPTGLNQFDVDGLAETSDNLWDLESQPIAGIASPLADDDEAQADLTMFYIYVVFPAQFPAHNRAGKMGWLLELLTKSPKFSLISSSIGALSQWLDVDPVTDLDASIEASQTYQAYHNSTLAAAQWSKGPMEQHGDQIFEDITCYMQLSLLISLTSSTQDCPNYFGKACQSFSQSASDLMAGSPFQREAMKVFGAQLLTADVLAATVNPHNTLTQAFPHYRQLLQTNEIDLLENVGYENWVILGIMDVLELEQWKLDEERHSRLSVRELVTRAEVIRQSLDRGLDETNALFNDKDIPEDAAIAVKDARRSSNFINVVFATSALVYLNTVVSGAMPHVPDVKAAVAKAISAWEALPEPCISLRVLKWPYCVAASFAMGPQRGIFQRIGKSATTKQQTFSNLMQLQTIVEDCWRRLNIQSADIGMSCDWRTSAQRLGITIFFG